MLFTAGLGVSQKVKPLPESFSQVDRRGKLSEESFYHNGRGGKGGFHPGGGLPQASKAELFNNKEML
jgi:hypothetical protein